MFGIQHAFEPDNPIEVLIGAASTTWVFILVWVALSLVVVELLNSASRGKLVSGLENSGRLQPVVAALIGTIPGCGGTVFLIPQYKKGRVSFASLTAAFIATMGEVAFLIIAINFQAWFWFTIISFVTAVVVGMTLELTPIGSKIENSIDLENSIKEKEKEDKRFSLKGGHACTSDSCYHNEGLTEDRKYLSDSFLLVDRKIMPKVFFALIILFVPLSLYVSFVPESNYTEISEAIVNGGYKLGAVLMIAFMIYYIFRSYYVQKKLNRNDRIHTHEEKVSTEHIVHDAFLYALYVGIWVFFGFLVIDSLILLIGKDELFAFFGLWAGFLAVLFGVLLGTIPGCGFQMIWAQVWAYGGIPTAALAGNLIVQDGDAGYPLIAEDKKSYTYLKALNIIPGLIVGTSLLAIENSVGLPF